MKLSLGESRLPDEQRTEQLEAIETLEEHLRGNLASQPSANLS